MRVGVLSYPMLFQRPGGLQIQVKESIAALCKLGLQAELVNPATSRLSDYDVVHVFSAINGNHRIVEAARDQGVPVVLSPLLSPDWDKRSGKMARRLDALAGRLSGWLLQTSYAQIAAALGGADRLLALGEPEAQAMRSAFGIAGERIDICPNGIPPHFFDADPAPFRAAFGIDGPFVLMAGSISPYKNQLGVVKALAGSGIRVVLLGSAPSAHQDYLEALQRQPDVRWVGALDYRDPLLASAYAAARVFVLVSQGELQPLSVLEAMAAGTPAVLAKGSALELPDSGAALKLVERGDPQGIRRAIEGLMEAPPPAHAVRPLVAGFHWDKVAERIVANYRQALAMRR
jgi:glycosyltransferase involved in cell wall biosynthesis